MKKQSFITFLALSLLLSCNNKTVLKQDLEKLQSNTITLSLDSMKCLLNGKDTLLSDIVKSELKLVIYTDSTACSPCALKGMYLWNRFIDYAAKYNKRLKFYFIFSPMKNELETIEFMLQTNSFYYPIFIDTANIFVRMNPHLPTNPLLHAFLLDEHNKVVLVGNPLQNKKIEELLYKITEGKLGKK